MRGHVAQALRPVLLRERNSPLQVLDDACIRHLHVDRHGIPCGRSGEIRVGNLKIENRTEIEARGSLSLFLSPSLFLSKSLENVHRDVVWNERSFGSPPLV